LPEALTVLIHDLAAKTNLEIEFEATGGRRPLPVRIEAGLYRVAQEALTNIIQHAEAEQVSVQLTIKPVQVQLLIEDDGQGFDPDQVPPGRYGLIGLNERVKLLGGQLALKSCPGTGTWIEVTVPLD
jgi:two-component system NarL family sensor kinase